MYLCFEMCSCLSVCVLWRPQAHSLPEGVQLQSADSSHCLQERVREEASTAQASVPLMLTHKWTYDRAASKQSVRLALCQRLAVVQVPLKCLRNQRGGGEVPHWAGESDRAKERNAEYVERERERESQQIMFASVFFYLFIFLQQLCFL